jgi:hypothetical protein
MINLSVEYMQTVQFHNESGSKISAFNCCELNDLGLNFDSSKGVSLSFILHDELRIDSGLMDCSDV